MRVYSDFKLFQDYDNHESVVEFSHPEIGLRGFVAIHNTILGPAVGGTRMYPYKTEKEAITDVLRLSHAMTYKCALAGVKFGGGKAVIIGDPKKIKNDSLLIAYAEEINKLKGKFFTGEDVGLEEKDVALMLNSSKYFIGRSDQAGDPSPFAAQSVLVSIQAACKYVFGKDDVRGRRVAIKGVGKVGSVLVKLLYEKGADIVCSDVDIDAIKKLQQELPHIQYVDNNIIATQDCDIYSPCALGDEFTSDNLDSIKAKIICGAANNQLHDSNVGKALLDRNITYVPDYIANAGGLIDVVDELNPTGFSKQRVNETILSIESTVINILERSKILNLPTNIVSDNLAQEVLTKYSKVNANRTLQRQ